MAPFIVARAEEECEAAEDSGWLLRAVAQTKTEKYAAERKARCGAEVQADAHSN